MIIEFNKKRNLYDDISNKLYNTEFNKKICYNFTPIEIYEQKYILTSSKNLEGYLMDYNKDVKVKLYIKNKNNDIECINLQLTNIGVFGSEINQYETSNIDEISYDCYIDSVCDLLLIKFNSSKLNYIKICNNLNCDNDVRYDEEIINLKYTWMNKNFEVKNMDKIGKIINVWNDKYINLPPIPLMINVENNESESRLSKSKPITGSSVFDNDNENDNNFLGIVSYINPGEIIIIPLISIKKICDYLFDFKLCYFGIDFIPIKFNFKSGLNNINYTNGLLITNNYYDNLLSYEKKIGLEIKKIINKNNNDSLLKKDSLQITQDYINLKKGNIICSVDGYKIDSYGNIIIGENETLSIREKKYKTIPFKSYMWLFKNKINNKISLKNISPKNYTGDLTNLQGINNELMIDDSCIKKHVNIIESSILIKTDYNSISSFGLDKIKYITYESNSNIIKLVELNEKTLEIIKQFLSINQRIYSELMNNIFDNKYSYNGKKTLLLFNFNERKLSTIKIISSNIYNYNDLLVKCKTNKDLKDFLISQI